MKKTFFEQYPMTDNEIKRFLQKGLLVFDTNVLLNLYFYTPETKNKMFGVMEKCKDRLWLPYQVGWEYFNNRKDRIEKLQKSCDVISGNVNDAKNRFSSLLNDEYQRHPFIVRKELIDSFKNGLKPLEEKLNELKKNAPDYTKSDTIWAKLEGFYDGKTGADYPLEKLKGIYKEGEERYSFEIPPGYADIKKKKDRGPRHLYGDVIIWKMVIEHAKENKLDVVFVTEEKKEDWFEKKREPRKDLLKEFFDKSDGQKVLICDQEEFLYLADKHLGTKVGKDAIKEIKEVASEERKREEEFNKRIIKTNAILEGWNNNLDSSIISSGITGTRLWDTGLSHGAYKRVSDIPLSTLRSFSGESGLTMNSLSQLYDSILGWDNPNMTLYDYLSRNNPNAGSLEMPDVSGPLGDLIQSTGSILEGNKNDDDRKDDTEDKKEDEGDDSKK